MKIELMKNVMVKILSMVLLAGCMVGLLPGAAVRADDNNPLLTAAYTAMSNMATVSWSPYADMTITYVNTGRIYKADTTYSGMPYSQTKDTKWATFSAHMVTNSYKLKSQYGTDCSFATLNAWEIAGKNLHSQMRNTTDILYHLRNTNFIMRVGSYPFNSNTSCSGIASSNSQATMTAAYKKLKKGNAMLKDGHIVVVYSVSSTDVTYIDQNGRAGATYAATCSWNTAVTKTFSTLRSEGYLPIYPNP